MEPEERVGSPGASGPVYALLCSVFRTVRDLDMAWEPFWGAIRRRVVRSLEEPGRSLAQVNGTLEACISPIDKVLSMRLLRRAGGPGGGGGVAGPAGGAGGSVSLRRRPRGLGGSGA